MFSAQLPNIILGLLIFVSLSCRSPLENVVEFNLRIDNQTETFYNIYRAAGVISGGAFTNVGSVDAMDSVTLRRLLVDVRYTFRLVRGDDPEVFDFEQVIQSAGDNIDWSVQ